MFAATIREGTTVRLPSKRLGIIEGWGREGRVEGKYLDNDEPFEILPKFCAFVSYRYADAAESTEPLPMELTNGQEG